MKLKETGYYAIGIFRHKRDHNLGSLWRTAFILGAKYIFTIGKNYKKQSSDVLHTWARIPLFHFDTVEDFFNHVPYDCRVVGVEMDDQAVPLSTFDHPKRAIYLLGAEDNGLPREVLNQCHYLVKLPGNHSLNVAVTGSIVIHDRVTKLPTDLPTSETIRCV
jgi:tRNA G18 (ribose-2'-O)-methylase SpoU